MHVYIIKSSDVKKLADVIPTIAVFIFTVLERRLIYDYETGWNFIRL